MSQPGGQTTSKTSAGCESNLGGKIHVIKVGTSSLLTNDEVGGQKVSLSNISRLVELIASLRTSGDHVVLVSSGAVGMGCLKLGLSQRPTGPGVKQALAAAGQSRLMRLYEDLFAVIGVNVAQLLISRDDFSDKARFLAVRNTFWALLRLGVVPIVNENDSLSAENVANFGDNDTMAAMTAVLLQADWVFLATDVDFLYTANPKEDPNATPIYAVEDLSRLKLEGLEASSSQWGTGGMATKIIAARIAVCAGVHCGLVNGEEPERIGQMIRGQKEGGTHFVALKGCASAAQDDHNRWIITLPSSGSLSLDRDGYNAVLKHHKIRTVMLLKCSGEFCHDEAVALFFDGKEIARALVRMSSAAITEEMTRSMVGLRDFTRELQSAGIYLDGYSSWRKGGHKGASGEMNAEVLRQLEQDGRVIKSDTPKSSGHQSSVITDGSDIALMCTATIKEADRKASSHERAQPRQLREQSSASALQ